MIENKNIVIFGFGQEGISAANYLGKSNSISIYDDQKGNNFDKKQIASLKAQNVKFYFEKLPQNLIFDVVIRSPGVRPHQPKIKNQIKNGAKLTSATSIFFENCPGKIIGVTGTKGKGTTSTLIYEILKKVNKDAHLAGNIGKPMLDILPKLTKNSFVVLELSSFQLIDVKKSPHIAVVLMVTSEHLDWHKNQPEYKKAKESIVKYQKTRDFAVVNFDFENSKNIAKLTKAKIYFFSTNKKTNGIYLKNGRIVSEIQGYKEVIDATKIQLPGKHNLQNICASIAVAKILDVENNAINEVIYSFKGLDHRLQLVAKVNNVKYFNDSYSTIPETTIAAIYAFENPKIVILGGSSKNSNFTELAKLISKDPSIKALIVIGEEAKTIKKALKKEGEFTSKIIEGLKDMDSIVKIASNLSSPGDIVLFSPACASFDMFKNYKDRGEQFIKEVKKLK